MKFDTSDVEPPPAPTPRRRSNTIPIEIDDIVELAPPRARTAVGTTPPPIPPKHPR